MDALTIKRRCLCERNARGQVTKRNPECPVAHRGQFVNTMKPRPVDFSRARVAVEQVRNDLHRLAAGTYESFALQVASVRAGVELLRRYFDGDE